MTTKTQGHTPGPLQTTRVPSVAGDATHYRVPCVCKWLGAWWTDEFKARLSHARHAANERGDQAASQKYTGALMRNTSEEARALLARIGGA